MRGTPSPSFSLPELSGCANPAKGDFPHDAPDLEALLPTAVAGREMFAWSVVGWCWIHLGWQGTDAQFAKAVAHIEEASIDVDDLRLALVGRTDVDRDPPYLVWVISVPEEEAEQEFAFEFLMQAIGVIDEAAYIEGSDFEDSTIAGKDVLIGSPDLIDQDDHQRGGPIEYGTGDYLFVVVTDDDAWAEAALSQLP